MHGGTGMVVKVQRQIGSWMEDIVDVRAINNVCWSRKSGGVGAPEPHFSLYGYIDYSVVKDLNIACSGRHDFGYNNAKVRIMKPKNRSDECYEGYEYLKKHAGPKPDSSFPKTACGKSVLKHLAIEMTRKELIDLLMHENCFDRSEISKTIRGLIDHGYIIGSQNEAGEAVLKCV